MGQNVNGKLLDAVINNDVSAVKHFLETGANPNYYEDCAKIRPIHFAALYNAPEAMTLLIMAGANIHATTETNDTALNIAQRYKHKKIVHTLMKISGISAIMHEN